MRPGGKAVVVFQVINQGAPGDFVFSGSDDQGFLGAMTPQAFHLGLSGSTQVTAELDVPPDAVPGVTDTLSVQVQSATSPGVQNFAVVTNFVIAAGQADADLSLTKTVSFRDRPSAKGEAPRVGSIRAQAWAIPRLARQRANLSPAPSAGS